MASAPSFLVLGFSAAWWYKPELLIGRWCVIWRARCSSVPTPITMKRSSAGGQQRLSFPGNLPLRQRRMEPASLPKLSRILFPGWRIILPNTVCCRKVKRVGSPAVTRELVQQLRAVAQCRHSTPSMPTFYWSTIYRLLSSVEDETGGGLTVVSLAETGAMPYILHPLQLPIRMSGKGASKNGSSRSSSAWLTETAIGFSLGY